eukprot:1484196-Rhodomonas_salina.2
MHAIDDARGPRSDALTGRAWGVLLPGGRGARAGAWLRATEALLLAFFLSSFLSFFLAFLRACLVGRGGVLTGR